MLEQNGTCQTLCIARDVSGEDAKFINDRIREDYALNWLVDGLPAAEMKKDLRTDEIFFDMGFNLGDDEEPHSDEMPVLNNHYEIVMRYHTPSSGNHRIVGVLVWPTRCILCVSRRNQQANDASAEEGLKKAQRTVIAKSNH
jgi:transmembrane 9 superfamily member 2/4